MEIERRYVPGLEYRAAEGDGGGVKIYGRAVPWDSLSVPLWRDYRTGKPVRERFKRGAFSEILAKAGLDIVALRDHEDSRLLGRTLSGTLRVYESGEGLDYDFDVPDTSDGRDVAVLVRRRDLRGSSFAFGVVPKSPHEEWEETATEIIRTIHRAAILEDVSPVTRPAYPASQVSARSVALAQQSLEAWRGGEWREQHDLGLARLAELSL